ncbi:MAG: UDP-N-acetylmuramyl pentapeptide phosphotransferase/UDP-N-acetylglucosamine-phosphate transferase [Clostridia bacterium]|jgi:UDP-GlcNAc:undecaprenyl-phosphate GlcNAc-1-phosphate transferase|nr:UDP-N-acetylmuramyl pentapeptide phosphotransferase/UDP-N-acetylglucosamine-phosphate transferase [Clostridia bacterium]
MQIVYFIIIITFVLSIIITPLTIKFANKFGFVDVPKDSRRVHAKPMPRIGGLAIVISMLIGLAIYYLITMNIPSITLNNKFFGYVLGALIISSMGLIDDVINMRARYKFIFQLLAATVIYFFGVSIEGIKIPFIYTNLIDFGFLSFPITLIWVIGITNAVNLIDGLDGLAAGISAISATALLTIFITTSSSLEAIVITAVLVGATLGFLPFNFNPAKTFMGDVGSNFLGFTLATVSILGFAKGYTLIAIIAPILTLGVPIFDTLFAMIRRFLAGKPMLSPDGGHVHHRLLKRGFNQRQAVLMLYTVTSLLCIVAVTIISADIYKLVLLIFATITFVILGYVTTIKHKNIKQLDENIEIKKDK